MSFSDWINQDATAPDPDDDDEAGWAFAHAARARAQAERQSNRHRRRRTWRTRAVLARRTLGRSPSDPRRDGDTTA